jgi:hypothetical protein
LILFTAFYEQVKTPFTSSVKKKVKDDVLGDNQFDNADTTEGKDFLATIIYVKHLVESAAMEKHTLKSFKSALPTSLPLFFTAVPIVSAISHGKTSFSAYLMCHQSFNFGLFYLYLLLVESSRCIATNIWDRSQAVLFCFQCMLFFRFAVQ